MRLAGIPIALLWCMVVVVASIGSARAATIVAVTCPGDGSAQQDVSLRTARCIYAREPGFHATHDGGPWVNVDLLHDSLKTLKAVHDGQPQVALWNGGPIRPPLDLVHAQICLSDPDIDPGHCPNNYPYDRANAGLGYRLNPKIIPLLEKGFENARRAGLKIVLRFTYNFPCPQEKKGCFFNSERDAPLDVILEHMREVAPVVRRNSDVVYSLQAGFIGRWGEWHNSFHGPGTNYDNGRQSAHNRFLDQYTALFQRYMKLEVRDPYQLLDYAGWRFGKRDRAHVLALGIALHDDAFGSDATDKGTYLQQQLVNNPYPTPYTDCDLRLTLLYVAQAYHVTAEPSDFYQFDGRKPCDAETYGDIISYSQQSMLTTFQLGFVPVLKSWLQYGYYDTMLDETGPHLSLSSATVDMGAPGPPMLSVTVHNSGWSAITGSRPAWLVLHRGFTVALLRLLPIDLIQVAPGRSVTVKVSLGLGPRVRSGTYQLDVYAPDASPRLFFNSLYALQFENRAVPDPTTGTNRIAQLTIR